MTHGEGARVDRFVELLPIGVTEVAHAWRRAASALLGDPADPDPRSVQRDLVLPLVVEPDWPGPAPPTPVPGGWVQADVTGDDVEAFHRLRSIRPGAGAEELSTEAQEWRLPVVPYRSAPWPAGPGPVGRQGADAAPPPRRGSLAGVTVVDMTSLWAGPLATRMLAAAGATVIKIDPDCRPDGFRQRPTLYRELNAGKDIVDLDLRERSDRDTFEELIADADLLIDSFSRRVLPNFGYGRRELRASNPTLATISIVGFPRGCAEQDWLAFGSGIHAISGLGLATGRARATPVAYPDPLTGYATFARALEVLGTDAHAEVDLISAAAAVHRAAFDRSPDD